MDPCVRHVGWDNWGKVENERSACFYEYRYFMSGSITRCLHTVFKINKIFEINHICIEESLGVGVEDGVWIVFYAKFVFIEFKKFEVIVFHHNYRCFGPGCCPSQRVTWCRELVDEEAEQFLMHPFIDPEPDRPWLAQRMGLRIPYSA